MSESIRRILRRKEVEHLTGLSRSFIYAKMYKGEFPQSIPLDGKGRIVGWDSVEIEQWIEDKINSAKEVC